MTSKVWTVMNDLEMITSKICSAREIISSAEEAIGNNDQIKAELLMTAAYEFLGYYLEEFDEKFKLAWNETVIKEKKENDCMPPWGHSDLEYSAKHCDKNDTSEYCNSSWEDFWMNDETDDKTKTMTANKWVLPVEMDGPSEECFIHLPDDLLEELDWKEGDMIEWIDNENESWTVKKI
jgi:hypothetical protein